MSAVMVLIAVSAIMQGSVPLAGKACWGAVGVLFIVLQVRMKHDGLLLAPNAIVVRRWLRRRTTMTWSQVDHFEMVSTGGLSGTSYVAVVRLDGTRVVTPGLVVWSAIAGERLIEELERHRAGWSSDVAPT
jgi:hypothetical protein